MEIDLENLRIVLLKKNIIFEGWGEGCAHARKITYVSNDDKAMGLNG